MNLRRLRTALGFTLVELMIVVAVIAILAAVAYPSYTEYVARGHRRQLQSDVAAAQQWLERYYSEKYTYPGAADFPSGFTTSPQSAGSAARYGLAITVPTGGQSYTLTATRSSGGSMASDACGNLSVNNLGERSAAGYASAKYSSSDDAVAACWR